MYAHERRKAEGAHEISRNIGSSQGEALIHSPVVRENVVVRTGYMSSTQGTTLVELLVALTISMILLSASLQGLYVLQQQFIAQQRAMMQQQEMRIGLQVLKEELRLAGGGRSKIGLTLLSAGKTDVSFFANLDGISTTLRLPVHGTSVQLPVVNGSGWKKRRHLLICEANDCVKARLATNGVRKTLTIESALGRRFSAGSQVVALRYIRYYVGKDRQGRPSLMRQIGGGVNSFVSPLSHFQMKYFTLQGLPTLNPREVSRVMVEIGIGNTRRIVRSQVALRG